MKQALVKREKRAPWGGGGGINKQVCFNLYNRYQCGKRNKGDTRRDSQTISQKKSKDKRVEKKHGRTRGRKISAAIRVSWQSSNEGHTLGWFQAATERVEPINLKGINSYSLGVRKKREATIRRNIQACERCFQTRKGKKSIRTTSMKALGECGETAVYRPGHKNWIEKVLKGQRIRNL